MREKINGYEYEAIKLFFNPEEYKEIEKYVKKTGIKKISVWLKMLIYKEIKGRWKNMTNAEMYLKEETNIEELVEEIEHYVDKKYKEEYEWFHTVPLSRYLEDFFNIDLNKPKTPTLTEDERVILKNLQPCYHKIKRYGCDLHVVYDNGTCSDDIHLPFNGLFQFIKERRRIWDKGFDKMNYLIITAIILVSFNIGLVLGILVFNLAIKFLRGD